MLLASMLVPLSLLPFMLVPFSFAPIALTPIAIALLLTCWRCLLLLPGSCSWPARVYSAIWTTVRQRWTTLWRLAGREDLDDFIHLGSGRPRL